MRDCGKIRALNMRLGLLSVLLGMGLASCSSSVQVDGFNAILWKTDTSACKNQRMTLVDQLINNKKAILSYKDEKIMDYLGKPDNTIFFARGKKTLIYSITPSKHCPASTRNENNPKSLRIDINALGRAELVYVLNQ